MLVELVASVDMAAWLDAEGIPDGTPFLVSPAGEYDTGPNSYGRSPALVNTQLAFARDMKGFLNFLWNHRPGVVEYTASGLVPRPRSWKDATVADRQAYEVWRNRDPAGPRVKGTTWNREVAMADGFYKWAVRKGLVASSSIEQRPNRGFRSGRGYRTGRGPRWRRRSVRILVVIGWTAAAGDIPGLPGRRSAGVSAVGAARSRVPRPVHGTERCLHRLHDPRGTAAGGTVVADAL